MKLLLDQGLPWAASKLLREAGIDAIHVSEIGYSNADDASILQMALEENRIVVTLDADFHALLALSSAKASSVIRIRIEGLRGEETANIIKTTIAQCEEELMQGAMVTLQGGRIRIRRLPFLP